MSGREAREAAIRYHSNLKPSFLALARAAGVTPKVLAKAMYDDEANTDYTTALLVEMIKAKVEKEKKAAEAER